MLIEEANGLDHLESLQNHSSQKIYEMSFNIVEKYFQGEVCLTLIISHVNHKNKCFFIYN